MFDMLVLPQHIYTDIQDIASEKNGLETGVALFGVCVFKLANPKAICGLLKSHHVVLSVAGPGPRAVHEAARYSADGSYYTAIYWALQSAMPAIEWLGELHVHPAGMPVLSSRDYQNVHEILLGEDDTVHPQEFIAGVIQRKKDGVDIYPYFFTRSFLQGRLMDIERVPSCAEIVRRARSLAATDGAQTPLVADRPPFRPEHILLFDTRPGGPDVPAKGDASPRNRWLRRAVNFVRRTRG